MEAQIIPALKNVEAGRTGGCCGPGECRFSQATIYTWKSKFGGMDVREVPRVRSLENENSRLKRLLADLCPDKEMPKTVIAKKRSELVDRRRDGGWLRKQYAVSERRVCGLMSIAGPVISIARGDRMTRYERRCTSLRRHSVQADGATGYFIALSASSSRVGPHRLSKSLCHLWRGALSSQIYQSNHRVYTVETP